MGETVLQVWAHTAHHRGQLALQIRDLGGEPPLVDYVVWIWTGAPSRSGDKRARIRRMKKLVALAAVAVLAAACSPAAPPAPAVVARNGGLAAARPGVTIVRDDWGIAHVTGKTDADAVFGMIYAQAEDDFNRIETNYLNSMGRLAEAEGETAIWQRPADEAVHRSRRR